MDKKEDILPDVKNGNWGGNAFKEGFVSQELSSLLGRILTIVDASTEGDKNLAMKSLIKEKFSDQQDWFFELSVKEMKEESEGHRPVSYWEKGLVPISDINKVYGFRH